MGDARFYPTDIEFSIVIRFPRPRWHEIRSSAGSMAHMIGEAARYTTARSIRVFQRMFVTTMLVIGVLGAFEGVILATSVLRWGHGSWIHLGLAIVGVVGAYFLSQYQMRQIDHYERERNKWRKGAVGECMVADVLSALSEEYSVINDVTTASGNLDHVVVGPTGVFAIETKNWRGLVASTGTGELKQNGQAFGKPVGDFVRRTMAIREQVLTLTRCNNLFIKAVMVFPMARVEAPFGTTSHAHCITDDQLCGYIENPKYARKLSSNEVDQIVRAFKGIAGMDAGFAATSTAAVKRSKSEPAVAASVVPNRT
jgi:hypothetical protein